MEIFISPSRKQAEQHKKYYAEGGLVVDIKRVRNDRGKYTWNGNADIEEVKAYTTREEEKWRAGKKEKDGLN